MNWLLILASFALVLYFSFAAPEVCGATGRNCVKGKANCVDGACVCKSPNVWGDPYFNCYRKNTVAAELKNDPTLTSFNNETVPFAFPCRYLSTHVVQELKDQNRNIIGKCEFKVSAFNGKGRGKYYLHGFDVATKIVYDDGRVIKMSSRHYGTARSGVYTFKNMGTMGSYKPDGPWGNDDVGYEDAANGIKVEIYNDDYNNQFVYEFKRCGLRATLVPYDTEARREQVSIPGLAIEINCAHHPVWLGYDEVMALAPSWQDGALLADHKINGLTEEESMFVRAFKIGFEQNQPYNDKGQCDATRTALLSCSRKKLKKAIKNCFWMLKQPRFVYCMDKTKSAKKILKLFSKCVEVWCDSLECKKVQKMIKKAGCDDVRDIEELPPFMAGDMCPKE